MPFLRMTPAPGDEHSGLPSSFYQFATHRWLLTGDAGEPALNGVLDYLELQSFPNFKFLQIPHHGS